MKNFQQKSRFRRIFESWPVLALLLILLVFFAIGVFGLLGKMKDTAQNKALAEERLLEIESRKTKRVQDIEALNTDIGKEKVFRENFGLAKEGEGLIVVVEDKNLVKEEDTKSESGFIRFIENIFR